MKAGLRDQRDGSALKKRKEEKRRGKLLVETGLGTSHAEQQPVVPAGVEPWGGGDMWLIYLEFCVLATFCCSFLYMWFIKAPGLRGYHLATVFSCLKFRASVVTHTSFSVQGWELPTMCRGTALGGRWNYLPGLAGQCPSHCFPTLSLELSIFFCKQ